MRAQRGDLARLGGVGAHESLGQTHDAELEALHPLELVAFARHDLEAASADVDDDRALATEIESVRGGEEDQPRFLGAGDDVDVQAEAVPHAQHEFAAVLGLADGAGRHGEDGIGLMLLRQPLEGFERPEADVDRGWRQPAGGERRAPEADHLLGAIDDLEAGAPDAGDHHVDRVGADVDCGDLHDGRGHCASPIGGREAFAHRLRNPRVARCALITNLGRRAGAATQLSEKSRVCPRRARL